MKPGKTDNLIAKCAEKLHAFERSRLDHGGRPIPENEEMWQVWEVMRILTSRVRDLERQELVRRNAIDRLLDTRKEKPSTNGNGSHS